MGRGVFPLNNHGVNDMAAKKAGARAGATKRKKAAKPKKAKRAAAKKSKKTAKKSARRPAKTAKKTAKKSVKAAARKAPAKKAKKAATKQIKGEGDYAASRSFLKDQSSFVAKNKANIPAMGKEAEAALEGPEGTALREAEATAAARSRDTFDS